MRECRNHFDVEPKDVGRALDKLCVDGVLARRLQQGGGELTELSLLPPEATAQDMGTSQVGPASRALAHGTSAPPKSRTPAWKFSLIGIL